MEANFKWKQAQLMVDYAFKQLTEAVQKWQSLPNIEDSKLEERYSIAMIARNNLVASAQNITGAQRYLTNVEFPYCTPSEVGQSRTLTGGDSNPPSCLRWRHSTRRQPTSSLTCRRLSDTSTPWTATAQPLNGAGPSSSGLTW